MRDNEDVVVRPRARQALPIAFAGIALIAFLLFFGRPRMNFLGGTKRLDLSVADLKDVGAYRESQSSSRYRCYFSTREYLATEDIARKELGDAWEEKIEGTFRNGDTEVSIAAMSDRVAEEKKLPLDGTLIIIRENPHPIIDQIADGLDAIGL